MSRSELDLMFPGIEVSEPERLDDEPEDDQLLKYGQQLARNIAEEMFIKWRTDNELQDMIP